MTQTATRAVAAGQPRRTRTRRDLQGLRGVGVLLVVCGHLFRWPPGVFAALDIFFVLSGFLITAILIDAFDRSGRIYFVPFYLSRFRRLAPTAVTVIAVTTVAFYLVFSEARGDLVARDGLWALLLVVNWHFAVSGTNYFQDTSESPLLHYWSLSVEEQFYAGWPLLLLAALLLSGTRTLRRLPRGVVLFGVLGAVSAASFAYSMWHSATSPTEAYFSTFDRVWEFGVGGLVAAARPRLARIPGRVAKVMAWAGTLGFIPMIFLIQYGMAFPAPWALPAVLLTAAVVAAGINRDTAFLVLLDNRAMVYVGNISYSVYLWHLPVNVLLKAYLEPDTPAYYATAIAATAVLSVLSFHLLERPMRYAPWLMLRQERRLATHVLARRAGRMRQVRNGRLAVAAAVTAGIAALAALPPAAPPTPTAGPARIDRPSSPMRPPGVVDTQQAQIAAALDRATFPDFDPPLERLDFARWGRAQREQGCIEVTRENLADCRFGTPGAARKIVVVGDSVAVAWMPGIRKLFAGSGWDGQQLTRLECPAWTLPRYLHGDGRPFPECSQQHAFLRSYILREKPDVVVLATGKAHVRNAQRRDLPTSSEVGVAQLGLSRTLKALAPSGARLVTLAPPPGTYNLVDCVTRRGTPDDCVRGLDTAWEHHVAGERAAAASLPSSVYVQTKDWFCAQDLCPAFVGDTPVTVDGSHLTLQYSRELAPLLRLALLRAAPQGAGEG